MKKIVLAVLMLMCALSVSAQNDVTQFLGIPVDGTKEEMISKLKEKGFRRAVNSDADLVGEFNGRDVNIYVVTNNNKVWRILVKDAYGVNETDIRIRFNNLCRQFENNSKYQSFNENSRISADEKISYEMTVHNKRYQAAYYQTPDVEITMNMLKDRLSEEELINFINMTPDAILQNYPDLAMKILDFVQMKSVWFMIHRERFDEYYILMYYDNKYNEANGDDL